jgi:hypothetical protein
MIPDGQRRAISPNNNARLWEGRGNGADIQTRADKSLFANSIPAACLSDLGFYRLQKGDRRDEPAAPPVLFPDRDFCSLGL